MRLIFKALLVLACLIPTLPAAGADSESRFIRIQRNENREPVAISIFRRASEKLRVALRDAAEPGWREQLARDILGSKPGNG